MNLGNERGSGNWARVDIQLPTRQRLVVDPALLDLPPLAVLQLPALVVLLDLALLGRLLLGLLPVGKRNWVLLSMETACSLQSLLLQLVELHLDQARALRV